VTPAPYALIFMVVVLAFGAGWFLARRRTHAAELELAASRAEVRTAADVARVQHMMGAESGAARRQMLEGVEVDLEQLPDAPRLVIGAGLDRYFAEPDSARLAEWLNAEYEAFGAHSHYGLVVGEQSYEQVADAIRVFIETHRV